MRSAWAIFLRHRFRLFVNFAFQEFVMIFLVIVFGRFAFERGERQAELIEDRCRLEIVDELVVLLEGASHLLPGHELGNLLRHLPEFLEVDVSVWQS